jgi:hypothetical protein
VNRSRVNMEIGKSVSLWVSEIVELHSGQASECRAGGTRDAMNATSPLDKCDFQGPDVSDKKF